MKRMLSIAKVKCAPRGFAQIVICSILVLCFSAVGLCGVTTEILVEVWGGESGDVYGYTTVPLYGAPTDLGPGDSYAWKMSEVEIAPGVPLFPGGIEIAAENQPLLMLAHLVDLDVTLVGDPVVTLGFSVEAGAYSTAFSFKSPVLSFPTITNPTGEASGSVSLGSGGELIFGGMGGKIFRTLYNTDGGGSGGAVFADIVTEPPGWGYVAPKTINDDVSSIHIKSGFILTAGGTASGNATFVVTPEPATLLLLGLGGLLLRKKRNRQLF